MTNGVLNKILKKFLYLVLCLLNHKYALNVLKTFSPEIVLSKHFSICRGLYQGFEGLEVEIDFYRSFLEDDYDEEYIDEPIDF